MVLLAGVLMTGCDRGRVRAYRAPKDSPATQAPPVPMDPAVGAARPAVRWKLPGGWKELPPGQVRVGSFAAEDGTGHKAQVTIIPLSGQGGGELENVNRWRGQVGLGRIDEIQMGQVAEAVTVAGGAGRLFDFSGTPPEGGSKARLLAVVHHREGTAWFIKMLGDDEWVAAQKAVFVEFLKGIAFEAAREGPASIPDDQEGNHGR